MCAFNNIILVNKFMLVFYYYISCKVMYDEFEMVQMVCDGVNDITEY